MARPCQARSSIQRRRRRRWMISVAVVWLLGAPIAWAQVATPTPGANRRAPLGTNLTRLVDWAGEWPFVDVFKASRPWAAGERSGCWDCAGPLDVDARGWVRSLDASRPNGGQVANTAILIEHQGRFPAGRYTVLYEGEGTLDYRGAAQIDPAASTPGRDVVDVNPARGDFFMTLMATNPANYLRNIRVIRPGGVCTNDPFASCMVNADCAAGTCDLFIDNYNRQIFDPDFLRNTRPYRVLRFIDWMGTDDVAHQDFQNYPQLGDARWNQAPVEIMCDLANRLGADPWFNMPHRATDAFVREFATRVRDRLAPGLRAYIEYSNEVWNPQFAQHAWVAARGCREYADIRNECDHDANPSNGVYCEGHPWPNWNEGCATGQRRYFSQRSVEIFRLFASVFGGTGRLVRVMASQIGNPWLHEQYLQWQNAHLETDVLAVAPYFAGDYGGDPNVATWTVDQLFASMDTRAVPQALARMRTDADYLAASHPGIELVAYEGGQHLVGLGGLRDNGSLNALFDAANRDPRMEVLYRRYLDGWRQAGGRLFLHYANAGNWSQYGRWGALEWQDQPHAASPKYRALMGFIADNPCWWPGCDGVGVPPAFTPTPPVTPTPAHPTATATTTIVIAPTSTPTEPEQQLSGRIVYYRGALSVPGVEVSLGAAGPAVETAVDGSYRFDAVPAGNWTLSAGKTAGFGTALSALDAAWILQNVVGRRRFNAEQELACDVTANGSITSLDAARVLQLVVGKLARLPVAAACASDWAFVPHPAPVAGQRLIQPDIGAGQCAPGGIAWEPLRSDVTGQDLEALLFGDCTGNWQPTATAKVRSAAGSPLVRIGRLRVHARRGRAHLSIFVHSPAPFSALQLRLRYDSTHLRRVVVRKTRRAGDGSVVSAANTSGLVIALATADPIRARRTHGVRILRLDFEVAPRGNPLAAPTIEAASIDEQPADTAIPK